MSAATAALSAALRRVPRADEDAGDQQPPNQEQAKRQLRNAMHQDQTNAASAASCHALTLTRSRSLQKQSWQQGQSTMGTTEDGIADAPPTRCSACGGEAARAASSARRSDAGSRANASAVHTSHTPLRLASHQRSAHAACA